jgi:hypothetical protein
MTRIEILKQIVANHQAEQLDGMWVDVSSAHVYVTIYEALNETNQARLNATDLYKAMRIVWDLSVRN